MRIIKSFFAFSMLWLVISCYSEAPHYALPALDLNGVELQVVEKIDSLQNTVIENPNSAEAWGKLGMNLYVHDLQEQSIVCFERAAALDTTAFRWPYLNAYTRSVLHLDGVLDWFARTMRLNPRYPPFYIRYGDALFKTGRFVEADKAYKKARAMNPRSSHVYLGLARVAFSRNGIEKGLDYLQKALVLNPNHGEAYGLLATIYRRMKLFDKSNEAMRMARSLPADTKLSEPIITEVIQEGVSSYWYSYRAREYAARARFHAAIKEYKKSLQYKPSARTYRELGHIYRKLKNYDTALKNYRKSLILQPDDMNTMQALSAVYRQIGDDELAGKIQKRIQSLISGNRVREINTFTEREENEKI